MFGWGGGPFEPIATALVLLIIEATAIRCVVIAREINADIVGVAGAVNFGFFCK